MFLAAYLGVFQFQVVFCHRFPSNDDFFHKISISNSFKGTHTFSSLEFIHMFFLFIGGVYTCFVAIGKEHGTYFEEKTSIKYIFSLFILMVCGFFGNVLQGFIIGEKFQFYSLILLIRFFYFLH